MTDEQAPQTLVVNFNAPELNQLALALAGQRGLLLYVRPYVNKGRGWENALGAMPLAGAAYDRSFGRRRMTDPGLARLTHEAGVIPDMLAAAIARLPLLPARERQRGTSELYKSLREAVADAAADFASKADVVVAYEGFALPSFEVVRRSRSARAVLNYPVAHHRQRRQAREEELAREPSFASTWPDFDDWPPGHEARLDEEISLAHAVLVGSSYAADSFVAAGVSRAKMKVVPYGVDLDLFHPPAVFPRPEGSFKVLYSGQLTQRKGLSYLLRGYRRFARRDSQLTLVGNAVGGPEALQPFVDLFRHLPHQTRPALAQIYREADVFVFPTLVEGMPLVVLEAMACGLPVIVTANGPADIVRDGVDGFVIPDRDEEAVADRLERLYHDRDLRAEMGFNASRRALEFGWGAYTAKVGACLSALVRCEPE